MTRLYLNLSLCPIVWNRLPVLDIHNYILIVCLPKNSVDIS